MSSRSRQGQVSLSFSASNEDRVGSHRSSLSLPSRLLQSNARADEVHQNLATTSPVANLVVVNNASCVIDMSTAMDSSSFSPPNYKDQVRYQSHNRGAVLLGTPALPVATPVLCTKQASTMSSVDFVSMPCRVEDEDDRCLQSRGLPRLAVSQGIPIALPLENSRRFHDSFCTNSSRRSGWPWSRRQRRGSHRFEEERRGLSIRSLRHHHHRLTSLHRSQSTNSIGGSSTNDGTTPPGSAFPHASAEVFSDALPCRNGTSPGGGFFRTLLAWMAQTEAKRMHACMHMNDKKLETNSTNLKAWIYDILQEQIENVKKEISVLAESTIENSAPSSMLSVSGCFTDISDDDNDVDGDDDFSGISLGGDASGCHDSYSYWNYSNSTQTSEARGSDATGSRFPAPSVILLVDEKTDGPTDAPGEYSSDIEINLATEINQDCKPILPPAANGTNLNGDDDLESDERHKMTGHEEVACAYKSISDSSLTGLDISSTSLEYHVKQYGPEEMNASEQLNPFKENIKVQIPSNADVIRLKDSSTSGAGEAVEAKRQKTSENRSECHDDLSVAEIVVTAAATPIGASILEPDQPCSRCSQNDRADFMKKDRLGLERQDWARASAEKSAICFGRPDDKNCVQRFICKILKDSRHGKKYICAIREWIDARISLAGSKWMNELLQSLCFSISMTIRPRSPLNSVVMVAIWNPRARRIVDLGSGFVAHAELGLIITAAHIGFCKDGKGPFGRPKAFPFHILIGVIPETGDTSAVWRFIAAVVEDNERYRVDAMVLRIHSRLHQDVQSYDDLPSIRFPGIPIKHDECCKLRSLPLAKHCKVEESVRITGYSQGGEGLREKGKHISRAIEVCRGMISKSIKNGDCIQPLDDVPDSIVVTGCRSVGGLSGGPTFNDRDEVLGILSFEDVAPHRNVLIAVSGFEFMLQRAIEKYRRHSGCNRRRTAKRRRYFLIVAVSLFLAVASISCFFA